MNTKNFQKWLVEMDGQLEPQSADSSERAYMEAKYAWRQVKQYIQNLETEQQNKRGTFYGTGRVNVPLAKRAIEEFEESLIRAGFKIY